MPRVKDLITEEIREWARANPLSDEAVADCRRIWTAWVNEQRERVAS